MAKLFIVGTPIGNLNDISSRAIETLKSVDVIACEDTRHSLPLLNHFGISKKLISYHKFNEEEMKGRIGDMISGGENVALISDAGMPSVCDPGATLVSFCHENGIEVEVVPSATAVTSAIALSGLNASGFLFLGFLPSKYSEKVQLLSDYATVKVPIAIYSAPHDILDDAKAMYEAFGDRKAYVVKELTKLYERVEFTALKDFNISEPKGEYVLIVEGGNPSNPLNELSIEEHIQSYINLGEDKKNAIKLVAKDRGMSKNDVYQLALKLGDKKG